MTGEQLWTPSRSDVEEAGEAYLHYATGVAIINCPAKLEAVHGHEFVPENYNRIVIDAEILIWDGLRELIRHSNPPDKRTNLAKMEHSFDEALPRMRSLVDYIFSGPDDKLKRLEKLNPAFPTLRPAPFHDRGVYAGICHSRPENILTYRLIKPFSPHEKLESTIAGRTMAAASKIAYARNNKIAS